MFSLYLCAPERPTERAPATKKTIPIMWFTPSFCPFKNQSRIALKKGSIAHMLVIFPTLVPLISEKYTVINFDVAAVM